MKSGLRVIVADDRFGDYTEENKVLAELGIEVELLSSTDAERKAQLREAVGLLVNLYPMDAELIEQLGSCRVISRYGVGLDNVDIEAATANGIWVARVPDYSVEEVTLHAIGLLLSCVRNISYIDREIRDGNWNIHPTRPMHRIQGSTFGIVGYGRIGRQFQQRIEALDPGQVLVWDPYVDEKLVRESGARAVSFETLISQSDYISVHAPLTDETEGMFGAEEFEQMKREAILINTARGRVVQHEALIDALERGVIAAAGLDVFAEEPPSDAVSRLAALPNIVMTDHCGCYSEDSIVELKTKAARNILEVLKDRSPVYPVNSL